jgi:DNA phosphorothioation-dependent restriction protein DptG
LYNAGKIYFEQKDYQSAAKQFEAILSLYPFDYSSLLMMGWTHYQLGNTSQSRDMFNKVLAQAANDKSAILGLNSRPLEELRNQEKPIKAK